MAFRILTFFLLLGLSGIPWFLLHTRGPHPETSQLDPDTASLNTQIQRLEAEMAAADRDLLNISTRHSQQEGTISRLNLENQNLRASLSEVEALGSSKLARLEKNLQATRLRAEAAEDENLELRRQIALLESKVKASSSLPTPLSPSLDPSALVQPPVPIPEDSPPSSGLPDDFPVVLPGLDPSPANSSTRDRTSGWLFTE
ncbi:MAG: hypothetical protein ACFCU4_00910 [Puniceicoccaceae bacterium]